MHALENGVLVLTLDDDPGHTVQTILAALISDLVHVHAPTPVVIVLGAVAAAAPPVIDAVLRAHRMCSRLDVLMSVATPSAPARRALETQAPAHGASLVIHRGSGQGARSFRAGVNARSRVAGQRQPLRPLGGTAFTIRDSAANKRYKP